MKRLIYIMMVIIPIGIHQWNHFASIMVAILFLAGTMTYYVGNQVQEDYQRSLKGEHKDD